MLEHVWEDFDNEKKLTLFRCAKHFILPSKAGTSQERARSSYGQNSVAQSHKVQSSFLYQNLPKDALERV